MNKLICIQLTAIDIDTKSGSYMKFNGKTQNNGIGNILFQIASMYAYALDHGYKITVPGLEVYSLTCVDNEFLLLNISLKDL